MKIRPSTILSFLSGKYYDTERLGAAVYFGPLCASITGLTGPNGRSTTNTLSLKGVADNYRQQILDQLPAGLRKEILQWRHDDEWRKRIIELDEKYGGILITPRVVSVNMN